MKVRPNGNGGNGGAANGNGRSRALKIVVLALAVLIVAALAFRLYQRWSGPVHTVWIATKDLAAGTFLSADDVEPAQRRERDLPAGTVPQSRPVQGMRLAQALRQGEPVVGAGLRQPPPDPAEDPGLSELLPEGMVMMAVQVSLENVVMLELRRGDRLDIVASPGRRGGEAPPRVVASDVYVIAYVNPNLLRQGAASGPAGDESQEAREQGLLAQLVAASTAPAPRGRGPVLTRTTKMLLGVHPEHVLPVAQALDSGQPLTVVLHGRKEVREGKLLSIDGRSWRVETITGPDRGRVEFVQ